MSKFFSKPPFARLVGNKPKVGAVASAREAIADGIALAKAEINLVIAELTIIAKEKARGVALLVIGLVFAWLLFQGLFIFLGFVLAIWLQPWASVLIVLLVLLLFTAIFLLMAWKFFEKDASMSTSITQYQEIVGEIDDMKTTTKTNFKTGTQAAVATTKEAFKDAVADAQQVRRNTI